MSNRAAVALSIVGGSVALAAGLAVPATAAPAHAHAGSSTTTYLNSTGTTGSDVLRLTANLPAAVGPIPKNLDLGVLDVEGSSVRNPAANQHSSKAFSGLLAPTGTQIDALDALKAEASSSGPTSASLPGSALPSTNGLLSGSLLTGKASVDTSTDDSTSDISITNLAALQLGQLLGASTVQQIQSQVNAALGAAQTLISQLQALPDPTGNIAATVKSLQSLVTQLQNTDLSKIAVATVGTLTGSQSITHNSAGVPTATATTDLENLNILDGLLHVQAVKTSSRAHAAGTSGTGSANGHALVGKVTVGNSGLTATIGQAGNLLGLTLPILTQAEQTALNNALNQLESSLQTLLGTIGITTQPGAITKHVASDGTSASASANGLLITVAPGGTKVLTLAIGASAASVNVNKTATSTPPTAPAPAKPNLPATGGSPVPAGIGAGLAGLGLLALAVRRRRIAGR